MKTSMQELLEWVIEFEDKPVKPTLTNVKEKIWQLLPKEREDIILSYHEGYSSAIIEKPKQYNPEKYFSETFHK